MSWRVTSAIGRRVLWQLILSGIFDRYPNLKLVMTELRADWVPARLQAS